MLVQCPSCRSKFRVADDKVTERGVKVRCATCKNVFQVRKVGGVDETEAPAAPPPSRIPDQLASHRPGPEHDLFGMAELTGAGADPGATTAPVSHPGRPPPASARAAAALGPAMGLEEVTDEHKLSPRSNPPEAAPRHAAAADDDDFSIDGTAEGATSRRYAPRPLEREPGEGVHRGPSPQSLSEDHADHDDAAPHAPEQEGPSAAEGTPPRGFGALDPSQENRSRPETERLELDSAPRPTPPPRQSHSTDEAIAPHDPPAEEPKQEVLETGPAEESSWARELVSTALTCLLAAGLALAVSVGLFSGSARLSHSGDVIISAARTGIYAAANNQRWLYIIGKVRNRGASEHQSGRVVVELVSPEGLTMARTEAWPGREATPEELYALTNEGQAEQLERALVHDARPVPPGAEVPFFALLGAAPDEAAASSVHLRLEPDLAPSSKPGASPPRR